MDLSEDAQRGLKILIHQLIEAGSIDKAYKVLTDFFDPILVSAILAEREACAKICDEESEEMEGLMCFGDNYKQAFRDGCNESASKIRARSNAPEAPNKPQVGFFGLDLSSGKAKEENIAHDPVSA